MNELSRGRTTAVHLAPLLLPAVAALALGRPYGWLALLIPVVPAIVAARAADRVRGARSLVAFDIAAALLIFVGWVGTQAGQWWSPLAYVFPLMLLLFTLALVNFVFVTISRSVRAWRGQPFDYPWIPDRLAALVGLPERWSE